jgi:hypothetical protein
VLWIAWVAMLLNELRNAGPGFHREVCDQLDRASLFSLFNTAEGNSKRQGKQRAKFFLTMLVARRWSAQPASM